MKNINVKILQNLKISERFYKMRIESAYFAKQSKPGQFVEVRCSDGTDPLLRRPLSVHRISGNWIELLFEVVGKGTELLSMKRSGDTLDVIGPLGNGFTVKSTVHGPQSSVLIGGGIGVAPLVALAEKIVHGPRSMVHGKKKQKICVLLGAKTKSHILCRKDFIKLGAEVIIATEDGSLGKRGIITDCLKAILSTIDHRPSTIYACGPTGMLKAVSSLAKQHSIPCQVSFEEHMACGVGVCLGCPVRVRTAYNVQHTAKNARYAIRDTQYEYKMVCKDGPIFDSNEIAW